MPNALLDFANSSFAMPPFDAIDIDTIIPTIDHLIQQNIDCIETVCAQTEYHYENVVRPLQQCNEPLSRAFSVIGHMHATVSSTPLRKAYQQALEKLTDYSTTVHQHQGLYQAYQAIAESEQFKTLNQAQQTVVEHALRDFKLLGVHLDDAQKATIKALEEQLSQLTTTYEEHVLDATDHYRLHVPELDDLKGLPEDARQSAIKKAQQHNQSGAILTLDFPCYYAVVSYCENRTLREKLYEAYATRATQAPYDNSQLAYDILATRHQLAQALGFDSFAPLSLATKMATTTDEVMSFLNTIATKAHAKAQQEMQTLKAFAKQDGCDLKPWDIAYYSEKLKQQQYTINDEQCRPYFPLDHVLKGFFKTMQSLFEIEFTPQADVALWHDDVHCFKVTDKQQQVIGHVFADFYARNNKRGGAWMDECRNRFTTPEGETITPIVFVTLNCPNPVENIPSLLTHEEVCTIFHEFGHALHHLLTAIDEPEVGGVHGVPWDAVEFPSQLLEEWCFDEQVLSQLSSHYKTGESLPKSVIENLQQARHFQTAMHRVRQCEFALFDFKCHAEFDPNKGVEQIQQCLDAVRQHVAVIDYPDYHKMQNSFNHIFAGGYAAGYYSYQWAEVMALDGFQYFKQHGLFNPKVGQHFLRSYLAQGGAQDPGALFQAFMGRQPNIEALFTQTGLA